jgi:hypothetical protein
MRLMTAGPDGVRDPFPNTFAASKAFAGSGFSGSSVRPIVISFSSFTPASTRVRAVFGGCLSAFPRVIVTHAVLGHLVVQSRPKPRGGSIARYRHFAEAQPLLNDLFYEKREAALTGKQGWLVLERDGYIDGEYELRRAHVGLRRNWTTPRDSAPVPKV